MPEEPYTIPFGKARVAREGRDAHHRHHQPDGAQGAGRGRRLARDGVDAEVVDLRTWCHSTADGASSVAKTGRLLVADEDYRGFGMSGEIVGGGGRDDLGLLKAPVKRLAVPDVPIPYSRPLEQFVLPTPERIEAAVRDLVKVLLGGWPMSCSPGLSEAEPDAEGVLATWFVGDGDRVASGQLLAEVMVEKVSGEVLAPAAGQVRLLVGEDQTARQGEVIAQGGLARARGRRGSGGGRLMPGMNGPGWPRLPRHMMVR